MKVLCEALSIRGPIFLLHQDNEFPGLNSYELHFSSTVQGTLVHGGDKYIIVEDMAEKVSGFS